MAGSSRSTPDRDRATPEGYAAARDAALKRAVEIREMVARNSAYFELAVRADDAARIAASRKRIVYQSMENAYPIGKDISLLKTFRDLGVTMIGPVHFSNNDLADSATDPKGAEWNGLSPLGKEFVAEANRLGIVIDASHASDLAFDQMLALSTTPIVLSHSGAKAVFDHPRNIDDERIRKLAAKGGVIQINAYSDYMVRVPEIPALDEAMRALGAEIRAVPHAERCDVQGLCRGAPRDRSPVPSSARDDGRSDGAYRPHAEAGGRRIMSASVSISTAAAGSRGSTMSRTFPRSRGGCSRRDTARTISPKSGAAMCCACCARRKRRPPRAKRFFSDQA